MLLQSNIEIGYASSFSASPARQPLAPHDFSQDGLVLFPQDLPAAVEPIPFYNATWRLEDVAEPKKPVIIGETNPQKLGNPSWIYGGEAFLIKLADSKACFLPEQFATFADFVQQTLNYEFALDAEDAFRREAILLVDSRAVGKGQPLRAHGKNLHVHPPKQDISHSATNTRYYSVTSRSATKFFTGAIDAKDARAVAFGWDAANKYIADYEPRPGAIAGWTSVHPHITQVENSDDNTPRVFGLVGFLSPQSNVEPRRPTPMISRFLETPADERQTLLKRWNLQPQVH